MSSIKLVSDTLAVTPASGDIEYNGQFYATDSNASRAQMGRLVIATAKATTSGTAVDITGIPAWAKKVTVLFSGVSTSGTSPVLLRLGTSSGIDATNSSYRGCSSLNSTNVGYSSGFTMSVSQAAANIYSGSCVITNITGNIWCLSGVLSIEGTAAICQAGAKTLSDILTQLRLTTLGGTDTFDAGTINILIEG